ncbi:sigma-70 family RNA polymerase sigma factor [Clostridium kluyveri]|uniref:RNA polymerase sigma factor-related protein n=2 Tax=Clostridium kluyveri TaxID=1534 RepID=A5MZJ8_CLOK5|nr:sigma-70 family RNA polymerase sigma factor [Clostridium kluyveri]EDK34294.1 RNA polymerase sigma factor-related protein [Clostridium kluyveri DSM 555]BAH07060.1 hypothetical protein CKR_2009 [Clostridium kluyveri NBRC 12016]
MKINENNFIDELKCRNEMALDYIYSKYLNLVYKIVLGILNDIATKEDIEECVSDIFIGVWKNISKYNPSVTSFNKWLIAVSKYKAIDYLRKFSKYQQTIELEENISMEKDSVEDKIIRNSQMTTFYEIIMNMNEVDYDLLNYVKVENYSIEDFELDEATSKRIKNNIKKKLNPNKIRKYIAVALLLISLGSFTIVNPTLATNIQNSIIQTMQMLRGDYTNYKKYTNNVNLSSYDKGVEFRVNEIVSDNNEIWISYSIISDKKIDEMVKNPNMGLIEFKINGKRLGGGYGESGEFVNNKRYDAVLELDTMRENITDTFYLDMDVKSIGELQGDWKFKIKVNKNDIQKETKSYEMNKNINLGEDTLFIKRISVSPISTSVEFKGALEKWHYFLLDDKGNEIKARGGSSDGSEGEMHFNSLINRNTKYLTFIPFEYNDNYKPDPRTYDIDKLPLELPQGNLGKLIVNNIERDNDTLKISYTAEGEIPITGSEGLCLFDEQGKLIEPENRFSTQEDPLNQYKFEMCFKGISQNKKYKIGTMGLENFYKINNAFRFTIELK